MGARVLTLNPNPNPNQLQIHLASFLSLSTSSSTLATITPALRLGGSSTLTVDTCSVSATPRSSGVVLSIFFFLAFMMLGSVAYRGSLRRRSAVTTQGSFIASVSRPPSISRSTSTFSPSLKVSCDANAPCGHPMSAASIWPVWLQSSSMACLPRTTRPGSSFSTRALNSLATCRGTVSASVTTWIARSAPMARAVRSCSCAAVGPTVTATISFTTFFSLRRTASSTAISSKGFMLILTLAVSTPVLSGLTRIFTA
mmetsp:Transcript_37800/g.95967  ORF Transcript_37800/g.95967 Transcript_37800/m.95967 type:complete len:256 (+) Transcript_37800:168-935(+)